MSSLVPPSLATTNSYSASGRNVVGEERPASGLAVRRSALVPGAAGNAYRSHVLMRPSARSAALSKWCDMNGTPSLSRMRRPLLIGPARGRQAGPGASKLCRVTSWATRGVARCLSARETVLTEIHRSGRPRTPNGVLQARAARSAVVAGLPIGDHGVGGDREAADASDRGRGGVEAKTVWRELVQPAQVLHDRDASRQQRGAHRTRRAAGVVDVERVDAGQAGLLPGQPAGGGSGE